MDIRALTTVHEFRQVFALERQVWGTTSDEDLVPILVLQVAARIGGLVLGAFEGTRLVGFAFSMPGIRDGRPYQWSHMVGVDAEFRNTGVGSRLKAEQRRLAMAAGLDLVAWTFDPLQSANAHMNVVKLGCVAREYIQDAYPASTSALHVGTATDRLVAEWWLRSDRVTTRFEGAAPGAPASRGDAAARLRGAVEANQARPGRDWLEPGGQDLSVDAPRLAVVIPSDFAEMQRRDLPLARAWRAATRKVFSTLLPRGFVVEDFVLEKPKRIGTYVLTKA